MPKQGDKALLKRAATKTFDAVDPQGSHNYDNLVAEHGLLAPQEMRPEVVVNMSREDRRYMAAVRRRGEDLTKPRISLSTIHRMKGGEDDNVLLLTDSSYPAVNAPDQDDEHRVFYTAVTRARENLHVVDSRSQYRYSI
jgi:superfamily I DNA/RNA helicase